MTLNRAFDIHPEVTLLSFLGLHGMSLKNGKKEQNKERERENIELEKNLKQTVGKEEEMK